MRPFEAMPLCRCCANYSSHPALPLPLRLYRLYEGPQFPFPRTVCSPCASRQSFATPPLAGDIIFVQFIFPSPTLCITGSHVLNRRSPLTCGLCLFTWRSIVTRSVLSSAGSGHHRCTSQRLESTKEQRFFHVPSAKDCTWRRQQHSFVFSWVCLHIHPGRQLVRKLFLRV